ncbi:hypothetical protein EK21DRAFT_104758 [Setomelanomma holmii]|uniref:C2H2-type domain-containing protein n=1 Tax=Setomelanomma holmii TaxID=210430 RepID=A0A9P4GX47_9PLEO|nr:hypothetical protein EK21DRAFT_104758 [Setomelanomma holmii]
MSEPTETSGRPLVPNIKQEQQPEGNTINQPSSSSRTKHRKSSQPSDDCNDASKFTNSRRRPGTTIKTPSGPHAGSSRSEQRSTTSPANMMSQSPSINYTRTGRISKAKKGLKVHNCECGRSYTRAEHLRRHQKNHAQEDALVCEYPDCGKTFYRPDLLHRHQERQLVPSNCSFQLSLTCSSNEPGKDSRQPSLFSPEGSPEAVQAPVPVTIPTSVVTTTLPLTPSYYPQQAVSPMQEPASMPRYTCNPFRTPQVPRTPRLSLPGLNSRPFPTSSPNDKQRQLSYSVRPSIGMPVTVDGMTPSMGWAEPYGNSPEYTSSGYTSPNPGPCDYPQMYAPLPYGHGANRTRTSSNASFVDQWSYTPRSPTSSASTMPYGSAWNDKTTHAPSLAYMNASYSMNSLGISTPIDPMTGYGQFESKTMMQRDEEEGAILYPEQAYGMGIEHTYPSEHYLNNYWRLFHPTFPIVHRSAHGTVSPMLRAAMIAIGGQYSSDTSVKSKARKLHDKCMKLLAKREREPINDAHRLCDYQSVFLVEVLSQYRARRAGKQLSHRFGSLYHKAAVDFTSATSQLSDIVLSLTLPENVTTFQWTRWIELGTWQRLLVSCYILEAQQTLSLAREPQSSLIQVLGVDLPFPIQSVVWDAATLDDWAMKTQQCSPSPRYVYEVRQETLVVPCDAFQSSLLVVAYYNRFDSVPYVNMATLEEIDFLLDDSFATKEKLLTAKLLQVTPIRALLAVSGESWILMEKVPDQQAFTQLKTTLRTWVNQLWTPSEPKSQHVAVKEAIKFAIDILHLATKEQRGIPELEMGSDMGIYFAALVLWGATASYISRIKRTQQVAQIIPQGHFAPPSTSINHTCSVSVPSTPTQHPFSLDNNVTISSSTILTTMPGLVHSLPGSPSRHDSLAATTLLSHEQITFNTISFLPVVMSLATSNPIPQHQLFDLGELQAGCISMLLWVKRQLRGASFDDDVGLAAWAIRPGEGLGELLDSVVGSLERILNRPWSGWGI